MTSFVRTAGSAAAALFLSGCMIPQTIATLRDERIEADQAQVVRQTVVSRLQRIGPKLRIGPVDCSAWTRSGMYDNVCILRIDGRRIPVGVRYDEDRRREVAELLGSAIPTKLLERSIDQGAWVIYRVRGQVDCGSTALRVLPVGSSTHCAFVTRDARRHDVRLKIVARLTPHAEIVPLAGFRIVAGISEPFDSLERAFRAHPGRVPGPLVATYLNARMVPYLRAMDANLGAGRVRCPPQLDARVSTLQAAVADGCWMKSNAGDLQVAVYTGDTGEIDFENLSRVYDLHLLVTSVQQAQKRYARTHAGAPLVSVDCGTQRRIVLTLLSVHYCAVRLSNGRNARLGIEYYDPFEGPHVVVERRPRSG